MIVDEFILRHYFGVINNLQYECYVSDAIPETVQYPFVVIGEVQCIERVVPCPMWICYVTLDIVTGSKGQIGRVQSLEIADNIHQAIKASAGVSSDGYKVNSIYTTNSAPLSESDSINYIYRNIRTYINQVTIIN